MKITYRKDYKKPTYAIDDVQLELTLDDTRTHVKNTMKMHRTGTVEPLVLNGSYLELLSVKSDGVLLPSDRYTVTDETLTLDGLPDSFTLEIETRINPKANTRLSGLYWSKGLLCTQCEPEGFRAITYYMDHPDVMAPFTVTIHADRQKYPVLLSNGNLISDTGDTVCWQDPFKKPSYLFALVAGKLDFIEDFFTTMSGRRVTLRIYAEPGKKERLYYAMDSLKRAMKWDEEKFGREYDLDLFNIVAVSDFNAGAMENKSLNIFNDQVLLADEKTASDANYENIEGVVAHEYFHNWSGDRVTARDWFNLSLKEGFTVYRDQEFSSDQRSRTVKRIDDVDVLKNYQFPEDDGPLAHPVRPDSFATIENFYTTTVYDKGAELIRMQEKILGYDGFHKGCDLYFSRHDGQAVTIDDFVKCMEDANKTDLSQFMRWYSTPGRPTIHVTQQYDLNSRTYTLTLTQKTKTTTEPFVIPLDMGLIGPDGKELLTQTLVLTQNEQTFTFKDIPQQPVLSLNRSFTAPVTIDINYTDAERLHLMTHDTDDFNRYELGQNYALKEILNMVFEKRTQPNKAFIQAFGSYLNQSEADPAFVARAVLLPAASFIGDQMDIFDVDAVLDARRQVRQAFADTFKDRLKDIYTQLADFEKPFSPDPKEAGKRALKNAALNYLALTDEAPLVQEAYQKSTNMTDLMAALSALVMHELPGFEEALQDFYHRYEDDHLVLNKWFSLQAMADLKDSLPRVRELMQHPKFQLTNPNNVRAVIGGFTHNLRSFHATDGSGYQFLADQVIALNTLNPQMAERILHPLTRLSHFNETRRMHMKDQLERILKTDSISVNVQETISRALKGA